jgi:transcriptional regulator with XRE-family HTH domain
MNNNRDEELLKRFGENLRKIRKGKGISQETLAFKANIPSSQITRIERGIINTTISTANLLARVLEVEISRFFE